MNPDFFKVMAVENDVASADNCACSSALNASSALGRLSTIDTAP